MVKDKMTEMLRLSAEVHEKIIRQIVPEATDEQVDFVVCNYPQINPFYYPHWWDGIREEFGSENSDEIDKVYERVASFGVKPCNRQGVRESSKFWSQAMRSTRCTRE